MATSKRLGLDRYLLSLNWFSSSRSCWLVNAVRGRRHFPIKPDCGAAVEQTVGEGQDSRVVGGQPLSKLRMRRKVNVSIISHPNNGFIA